MNRGVPPTDEKALTGEFTPPGMTAHASASSAAEAAADDGVRCMTTSVPARAKPSTTGCSGSALGGQREDRVIGVVRKLAPVAIDDLARERAVDSQHRRSLFDGNLRRDVLLLADRHIGDCTDVFHPLRLTASGDEVLHPVYLRDDYRDLLGLLADALGHGQCHAAANASRHRDPVEALGCEPRG